jgi:hypothetical protein
MGFNQCYLPSIIIMEAEIKSIGLEKFVKRMQKYESITGETDRMQFLESKVKEYYEQNKTTIRNDSE